jgi:hypothetical protein
MSRFSPLLIALLCVFVCVQQQVEAFAPSSSSSSSLSIHKQQPAFVARSTTSSARSSASASTSLHGVNAPVDAAVTLMTNSMPTTSLAAMTLDPATFFSDILSAFLNTPIILAVPIVAALGVSGLLAWLIVSYANPVEDN